MIDILIEYYNWILILHVMSFMSWMAMLFYLPRIYVYHIEQIKNKEFCIVAEIQEYKLYKYIGLPAFWATLLSGSLLIISNLDLLFVHSLDQAWLSAKIFFLVFLTIYSFSLETYRKQLKNGTCKKTGNFFRMYNEIPTGLSLLIVGYVVTKVFSIPFTIITILFFAFVCQRVYKQKVHKTIKIKERK